MSARRHLTVAACLGSLFSSVVPAAEIGQALRDRLAADGQAQVVIALAAPSAIARGRLTASAMRAQVAAVQDQVLQGMAPGLMQVRRRFQAVPALAGRISQAALAALERNPNVVRVDLDVGGRGTLANTVPLIGADVLQGLGFTGSGVQVAVLDSGLDTDHNDLGDDLIAEECFLDFDGTIDGVGRCPNGSDRQTGAGAAEDGAGHGTATTGIITSAGSVSSIGVAPDAEIVAVKVLDNTGFAGTFQYLSEIIAALDWIINNRPDVDVINMSLGTNALYTGNCDNATAGNMALATAINTLRANGVISFASSGNDSSGTQMPSPACIANVVSVGATDNADNVAGFTDSNNTTDMMAPGVNVTSTGLANGTAAGLNGTSFASPHAAGCAALFIDSGVATTPNDIESRLEASPILVTDATNGLTFPRIDCADALGVATLIVEKQTLPDGSLQSFDFSGDAVGSIQDGAQIVVSLVPGQYTATETVPPGWDLTSIACDDANSTGNLGTATATFNLEAGETVTCTFTNTERATLIVEKQTIPNAAPGLFNLTGDVAGNIADGGQLIVVLPPSTYTSTETDPTPAFDLTGLSCVEDATQNSSVNLATRTATFVAEAGETLRCVFTNTQRGTIIIEKVAEPQDGTDFDFAGDLGPFTLDDASPDDNDGVGNSLTFPFLLPNQSYAVTEQGQPAGWLLQHILCDDAANTTVDLDNATANIGLDPGEEVRCVFTSGAPQVCKPFDRALTLTHNQTVVRNVQNFFALNPLSCPSGYIVAWAKDDSLGEKTPIEWNQLSGSLYTRAPGGAGLNKTYGAQSIVMRGDPQGLVAPGQALVGAQGGAFPDLPFDGTAYAELPNRLATDFVATVGQRHSRLVLLTPDINNPLANPLTQLGVNWWNQAEDSFSDSTAYRCHARRRLDDISTQFTLGALGSWYGNLRITPLADEGILGLIEEQEPNRLTLRNLFQDRPPPPANIINLGGRQPGSAVIFPLFDIGPAADGRPHISQFRLTNNHPTEDVDVHLFLICGQDRL